MPPAPESQSLDHVAELRRGVRPEILSVRTAARSRLFHIEAVRLRFSNGNEREYERLAGPASPGAVVVVPLLESRHLLLVREYAVGVESYQLGLPMGLIREGESPLAAANRELMEETGYAARHLSRVHTLALAPGILAFRMEVVVATRLYSAPLQGDEPEPLETVQWPIGRLDELPFHGAISDARTLAALFVAREAVVTAGGTDARPGRLALQT